MMLMKIIFSKIEAGINIELNGNIFISNTKYEALSLESLIWNHTHSKPTNLAI